jgi:hypothetical protein
MYRLFHSQGQVGCIAIFTFRSVKFVVSLSVTVAYIYLPQIQGLIVYSFGYKTLIQTCWDFTDTALLEKMMT